MLTNNSYASGEENSMGSPATRRMPVEAVLYMRDAKNDPWWENVYCGKDIAIIEKTKTETTLLVFIKSILLWLNYISICSPCQEQLCAFLVILNGKKHVLYKTYSKSLIRGGISKRYGCGKLLRNIPVRFIHKCRFFIVFFKRFCNLLKNVLGGDVLLFINPPIYFFHNLLRYPFRFVLWHMHIKARGITGRVYFMVIVGLFSAPSFYDVRMKHV